MRRTKEAWFNHPEALDDLEFLKEAAEIVFNLQELHSLIERNEMRADLAAAERNASWWKERQQAQTAKCLDAASCIDLRCRRSKSCRALRWISAKTEGARVRLAAEQAKWPAPEPQPQPPHEVKKKGRTGVRP